MLSVGRFLYIASLAHIAIVFAFTRVTISRLISQPGVSSTFIRACLALELANPEATRHRPSVRRLFEEILHKEGSVNWMAWLEYWKWETEVWLFISLFKISFISENNFHFTCAK